MPTFNFTTGPATLPDVGELSYNGCTFGPLFASQVSCVYVKDEANRTTKYIEYTISVDGYVTLPDGMVNVESTLATLEKLLSAPAGKLLYSGRGIKIAINTAGGDKDVAWGPIPEVLEIVPMGAGRSAKVTWTVKARVPPRLPPSSARLGPVLQFNFETEVTYDDAGYSSLSIAGTVEVPLTRTSVSDRTITQTADNFRDSFPGKLLDTLDLTRFRVTHREFRLSRDKRTLTFSVQAVEQPWMAMPPDVTVARGQFTFKPAKTGAGLANWLCSLTVTYTVPKGRPRRTAWLAFLALLQTRMKQGNVHGIIPPPNGEQNPGLLNAAAQGAQFAANPVAGLAGLGMRFQRQFFQQAQPAAPTRRVVLLDLSGTEGLYLDSTTVTFSATWRLVTVFSAILRASGLWKKVDGLDANTWAISVKSISGANSWLNNRFKPSDDAIVDFGF